jgi:hypothetical protein
VSAEFAEVTGRDGEGPFGTIARDASASFLKKRSKKLSFPEALGTAIAKSHDQQKFFTLFT